MQYLFQAINKQRREEVVLPHSHHRNTQTHAHINVNRAVTEQLTET